MAQLPPDIIRRVKRDFSLEEFAAVEKLLIGVQEDNINVGSAQLIRSILIIAKGDIHKIQEIIKSRYRGDPRDVIMAAMAVSGHTANYGNDPLPD